MKLGPTLDWTCDCKQTQLQPSSSSGSCIIATFNCSGPRKISQGDLDDYCKVRPGCFNLKAVWLRTMIMLVSLCHGACLSVLMNGWELGSEESVMNKPIAWEYLILKSMQAGRARWVCIRDRYLSQTQTSSAPGEGSLLGTGPYMTAAGTTCTTVQQAVKHTCEQVVLESRSHHALTADNFR